MSQRKIEELSDLEFDVLKEISNIGTGNAATAIAKMMGGQINIEVPIIKFLDFNELSEIIGGAENEVIGILVTLSEDIDGMMMFVMDTHSATVVVNNLLQRDEEEDITECNEMIQSALAEFGNIIAGSYLAAISKLTGLTCSPSVPALSHDMAGAVLSVPAIEFGKVSDKVLLIQSVFSYKSKKAEGFFILVPTLQAFNIIFDKLGL
ncbi:MAG: chemotaxis protein CheC [Lachnospiraceae bacterium]|nr:chemotaxis protein CheC [Lachnospiraceae bacterium]